MSIIPDHILRQTGRGRVRGGPGGLLGRAGFDASALMFHRMTRAA